MKKKYCNNHLIPGTTEYNMAIREIEATIGRELTLKEKDYMRKQCKPNRPRTGQGKSHKVTYWPSKSVGRKTRIRGE